MPARETAPAGAKVVKEELKDEAREKMEVSTQFSTIESFLAAKKKAEEEERQVLSNDLEVITNVTTEKLLELQGLDKQGRPTGQPPRLFGWDPKTKTACILKMAYLQEVKKV